jgi:hypothetical protein
VKSLNVTPKQFRVKKLPCKLRYHLFGQAGFWIILSFTGKGLCEIIPIESLSTNSKGSESSLTTSRSQTQESSDKFPVLRSSIDSISHQASDLAPIEPSELPNELALDPRIVLIPEQAESISTTRKLSERSFTSPALPSNRCWKSIRNCSYGESVDPILPIPPTEGRVDPEIGDLRLTPVPESEVTELGILNIQPVESPIGAGDPELGTLRLQERTTPQPPIALPTRPRQPSAFLLARIDYFKTANVYSERDPVDDGLIRTGLTFFYAPPIGSKTFLITSLDANLIRYGRLGRDTNLGGINYDELRLRAGIFHRFTPRVSGELGWSTQKLFTANRGLQQIFSGEEFATDNSIRFELSRQDRLSPKLSLNTFYQFRWSIEGMDDRSQRLNLTDDRSRVLNSFIATLVYNVSPRFQTAIDYQFTWSHFTQQERDDLYHQLVGRMTYNLSPRTQVNVFSGFSFGSSTDSRIDFNSFIFGAGLVFNLPLF